MLLNNFCPLFLTRLLRSKFQVKEKGKISGQLQHLVCLEFSVKLKNSTNNRILWDRILIPKWNGTPRDKPKNVCVGGYVQELSTKLYFIRSPANALTEVQNKMILRQLLNFSLCHHLLFLNSKPNKVCLFMYSTSVLFNNENSQPWRSSIKPASGNFNIETYVEALVKSHRNGLRPFERTIERTTESCCNDDK